jgi:hypothetical protein
MSAEIGLVNDALRHAGRMSFALDSLATALYGARYRSRSPEPKEAGEALTELLQAKRDYDKAIILLAEHRNKQPLLGK